MFKPITSLQLLLTGGKIAFLALGATLLGTTLLSACSSSQPGGPPLPPRENPALPDMSEAKSVDVAAAELADNASFRKAIDAGVAGNVDSLLELAVKTENWCATGRQVPEGCTSRDDKVDAVFQDNGNIQPVLLGTMRELLVDLYGGQAATLEFIARYDGETEVLSGKYFLVFKMTEPRTIGGELVADAIGLTLDPEMTDTPIAWFTFGSPGGNGLTWMQVLGGRDGASDFVLLAPESVKGWRDAEGNTVE